MQSNLEFSCLACLHSILEEGWNSTAVVVGLSLAMAVSCSLWKNVCFTSLLSGRVASYLQAMGYIRKLEQSLHSIYCI